MYKPQEDVSTFMRACDQEVKETPELPAEEILRLRCKLIIEEAFEFVEAAGCEIWDHSSRFEATMPLDRRNLTVTSAKPADIPEMAKELADINYVTYGAAAAIGVYLPDVFTEVQKSNMTKVAPDGKVIKNEMGKVQKPDTYRPANIESVLGWQGWTGE